jgi:hypothetical protein
LFAAAYAGEVGELAVGEGEDAGAVLESGGCWADVVFHFWWVLFLRWNVGWGSVDCWLGLCLGDAGYSFSYQCGFMFVLSMSDEPS